MRNASCVRLVLVLHPSAGFSLPQPAPKIRWLGDCPTIGTGIDACHASRGDVGSQFQVGINVLTRAAVLGLGISLFEDDWNKVVREAMGGSIAIESFVWAWNKASDCEPLPSGTAACDWLDGKEGSTRGLLWSMVVRGLMMSAGIALASKNAKAQDVFKKTAAAVTALELTIIAGAMYGTAPEGAKLPLPPAHMGAAPCKTGCR